MARMGRQPRWATARIRHRCLFASRALGSRREGTGCCWRAGYFPGCRLWFRGKRHNCPSISHHCPGRGHRSQAQHYSPARYLLLGDRIIPNTSHIRLLAARAARQLLVATVLTQPTAITRAHVPEVAALADLAGAAGGQGRKVELIGGGGGRGPGVDGVDGIGRLLVRPAAGRGRPEPLGRRVHVRRRRRVAGHAARTRWAWGGMRAFLLAKRSPPTLLCAVGSRSVSDCAWVDPAGARRRNVVSITRRKAERAEPRLSGWVGGLVVVIVIQRHELPLSVLAHYYVCRSHAGSCQSRDGCGYRSV